MTDFFAGYDGRDEVSESVVVIKSPFPNSVTSFDSDDDFPDLDFVIPGEEKIYHLHRSVLGRTSTMLAAVFKAKKCMFGAYDASARRIEWEIEGVPMDVMYRRVLVKWLRFCYGEDQSFDTDECPAALFVLWQLELKDCEVVKEKIGQCIKSHAATDIARGVKMLKECVLTYKMDVESKTRSICEELATILMTERNFEEHSTLLTDCIVKLPYHYLDIVEYGPPHSACSVFRIRAAYVQYNHDLDDETKCEILKKCDTIDSDELKALEEMHVFGESELIQIQRKALKSKEEESKNVLRKKSEVEEDNKRLRKKIEELTKVVDDTARREEKKRRRMKERALIKGGRLLLKYPWLRTREDCGEYFSGGKEFEMLCELLKGNATPTRKLDLNGSRIKDEGAIMLSEALMTNTTLTEVYLYLTDIGDEGVVSICESLTINTTLTLLNLSSNNFSDVGAMKISEMLTANTTLTNLHIDGNKISDKAKKAVTKAWNERGGELWAF